MRSHYLLEINQVKHGLTQKIKRESPQRYVIEMKKPNQGLCPKCGWRSRNPKTSGIHELQGLGARGIQVRLEAPWVCWYCRNPRCPVETFRFCPYEDLRGLGGLLPAVCEQVHHLSFTLHLASEEIVRHLALLCGVLTEETNIRRILEGTQIYAPKDYAPKHLGIDEFYPKGQPRQRKGRGRKRKRARLALLDLDLGVIITEVKGKSEKAAKKLLKKAKSRCDLSQVEEVTRDLCQDWDAVLHEFLDRPGHPVMVRVDNFHLVKLCLKKIYNKIYVPERKRLKKEGKKKENAEVFRNRYRFKKRRTKLAKEDKRYKTAKVKKLDAILDANPKLAAAYQFKEKIYELVDLTPRIKSHFETLMNQILDDARKLELKDLANTIERQREFISNNLLRPATLMLPEQCFSRFRLAEKRRRGFRTDRARERFCCAQFRLAVNGNQYVSYVN